MKLINAEPSTSMRLKLKVWRKFRWVSAVDGPQYTQWAWYYAFKLTKKGGYYDCL